MLVWEEGVFDTNPMSFEEIVDNMSVAIYDLCNVKKAAEVAVAAEDDSDSVAVRLNV